MIRLFLWFIVLAPLVDLSRHFLTGSFLPLLALDLLLVAGGVAGARALIQVGGSLSSDVPPGLKAAFLAFTVLIVTGALRTVLTDPLLALAGLRTYFVPLFGILLGLGLRCSMTTAGEAKIMRWLAVVVVVNIVVAQLQYSSEWGLRAQVGSEEGIWGDVMRPAEKDQRSFELSQAKLTSGLFASSKRFGRYLCFCGMIMLALMNNGKASVARRISFYLVCCYGIAISGARESMFVFVVAGGILLGEGGRVGRVVNGMLGKICGAGAALLCCWIAMSGTFESVSGVNYNYDHSRLRYLLSTADDFRQRVIIALPVLWLKDDLDSELLIGEGLARYGSEQKLVVSSALNIHEEQLARYFDSKDGMSQGILADAGMTRILVEFGVLGLCAVALCIVQIVVLVAAALRRYQREGDHMVLACVMICLSLVLFFAKMHVTMSDLIMSGIFCICIGYLLPSSVRGLESPLAIAGVRTGRHARIGRPYPAERHL